MDWVAITGVATLIQAIVVVIAVIYGIRQVKEAQRARAIAAFLPLFQALNSPESSALRRKLYTEIPNDRSQLTEEQENIVNGIVNQLDFLGFLTENGLLEFDLVAALYYGTIIRCWDHAYPYVEKQRELRKTHFAYYFEALNRRCLTYISSHRLGERIQTYKRPLPEGK
jgi:uncharacterized protein DUF4760